jgi:alpha-galactosidase
MLTLWCIFRSPLMLGAELTKMDNQTLSLITNVEALHLITNSHGALQIERDNNHAVWFSKDDDNNNSYVAIFNLYDDTQTLSVLLKSLEINYTFSVRDLRNHNDLAPVNTKLIATIPAHGAVLYKLSQI